MTESNKMYGFYSEKAEKACGSAVWRNRYGQEFTITYVTTDKEIDKKKYAWDDAVFVSEVSRCVLPNKRIGVML